MADRVPLIHDNGAARELPGGDALSIGGARLGAVALAGRDMPAMRGAAWGEQAMQGRLDRLSLARWQAVGAATTIGAYGGHGRDARGVDCVGLVALAYRQGVPSGYALRTADAVAATAPLAALKFRKRRSVKPGDILLLDAGPAQLHLGLWTGDSLIHADAGLRRVVETPGNPRWPILSIWRR